MLREAGYRQRTDERDLTCLDSDNDVEFFYLRPRDIATYVDSGDLDLGVTGQDLLVDSGSPVRQLLKLGFGGATFHFAAPDESMTLEGKRIATSYPRVVERYLAQREVKAQVVKLDGAVENAVRLGVADLIADVVATGATLRQAGLTPIGEPLLVSEAVLVGREEVSGGQIAQLVRRLQGVLVARRYVMLVYDVRADQLEQACALTPGIEGPTISQLHREGWVAVQAMVLHADVHRIMDELYNLGARAILVTNIHACRL
jgi:ATP phosphoribosyltransferase